MAPRNKSNILLVDDRPENLLVLEALLGDLGQNLVRATSGQDALRRLLEDDYALVLLDIQMPEMDGYETARLIRSRQSTRNLPILFISAIYRNPEHISRSYSLGAADYITKPFDPNALKAKVTCFVELANKKASLQKEVEKRGKAEAEVRRLNADLEQRVIERTTKLEEEVAERKRVEKTLRESEQRFRTLVEKSSDAIALLAPDGTVLDTGHTSAGLLGYEASEVIGRSGMALVHPDECEEAMRLLAELVSVPGAMRRKELRMRCKDGSFRWMEAVATNLLNEPLIGAVVVNYRDIGERKQAEEVLNRRQQEVEALNARLQRAMLETHHRVRNSLQIILAFLDLRKPEGGGPVSEEDLRRLEGQVRALAAVHDLLTTQAKRGDATDEISARDVLERLLDLLRQSSSRGRITARIQDARLTDRQGASLALVANELIANALRNSPGVVTVSFTVAGDTACLEISDCGDGFPDEFNPQEAANAGLELVHNVATWDLRAELSFGRLPEGGGLVRLRMPVSPAGTDS